MTRIARLAIATIAALFIGLTGATATAAQDAAQGWKRLLSPAELDALIAGDEVLLVDIRSVKDYGRGHVEGAVNVPYHAWRGPAENPGKLIDDAKLTLNLQQLGVEPDSRVVVTYQGADATDFGAAARVYWTIKSAGVDSVAILNGGVNAWREAGLPLSTEEASNFPSDTEFTLSDRWLMTEDDVAGVVAGETEAMLIDARPTAFFEGRKKHDAASWAGTLKDALNLEHVAWFTTATGQGAAFEADPETIRALARETGWTPGEPVVSFCNTGHWAASNWFALSEIAGIENVKLYPESMVGWTRAHERVAAN